MSTARRPCLGSAAPMQRLCSRRCSKRPKLLMCSERCGGRVCVGRVTCRWHGARHALIAAIGDSQQAGRSKYSLCGLQPCGTIISEKIFPREMRQIAPPRGLVRGLFVDAGGHPAVPKARRRSTATTVSRPTEAERNCACWATRIALDKAQHVCARTHRAHTGQYKYNLG